MRPNAIPSADLAALFPGVEGNLPLEISSNLFSLRAPSMPLYLPMEQVTLAAIVRLTRPRRLLEFGTAQGRTTFTLAANSPADAEIDTLDIARWTDYTAQCLHGDDRLGSCFLESPYAAKVRQVLRHAPDETPASLLERRGTYEYLHIDGDHSYSGVRTDTEAAFELAAPDAVFTWHDFYPFPDYIAEGPEKRGVYPYLNELVHAGVITLRHIVGTYIVVGCRRWGADMPGVLVQPGAPVPPFGRRNLRLADTGWG